MAEAPDIEENYMSARFKCDCGNSWISIRSLNLPEKCSQCFKRGCKAIEYRKATRPEQIQGKKMIMVAKYKCSSCKEKWKSVKSSGGPKCCPIRGCKDTPIVYPYKYRKAKPEEMEPKRKFGYYKCKCGKQWSSGYTWVGKYQECRHCLAEVQAHAIQPLKKGGGYGYDYGLFGYDLDFLIDRSHDQLHCQQCQELGYNCTNYVPSVGCRREVDFSDAHSIMSVASTTTTDVTRASTTSGYDVTPTVSDDEGTGDYLSNKLGNLRF